MPRPSFTEPLESRIAPATLINPLADIVASPGQAGVTIELGQMLDPFALMPGHTIVKFTLSLDLDPNTPGLQLDTDPNTPGDQLPTVVFELFDDEAPLTVANFLRYALEATSAGQFTNDYTGTFIHRIADFGSGSGPGIDIVQGGGFAISDLKTHIPTYSTLHNEYSPAHPNTRGTIAMGKTALGPHTASSEWFINTNDNSTILGPDNGISEGYTVFGQVIAGMEYIDKIAALQRINATSSGPALGELPVQNYSSTAGLKTENLVTITSVQVTRPQPGDVAGQAFEVVSIIDPLTGQPSEVVSAGAITGSKLPLIYDLTKSGLADVTVKVTLNGEEVFDTFRVTVRPNLIATLVQDPFPQLVVPGDSGTVIVKVTNNGAANFQGTVDIKFYLSPATNPNKTNEFIRDADDVFLGTGTLANQTLSLTSEGVAVLTGKLTIPPLFNLPDFAGVLIAVVEPHAGSPAELFTDDQVAPEGAVHAHTDSFGTITTTVQYRSPATGLLTNFGFGPRIAKLTYTEADNDVVTLSITGPGMGKLSSNEGGLNVIISGTNAASIVSLAAKTPGSVTPGRAQLHHIDVASGLGTLNFAQADVDGYITLSSGVKVAKFGNVTGSERTLILGGFGALNTTPAALSFGRVANLNIESDQRIATLTATEWLDTPGSAQNRIITPALTRLNVAGDFAADVEIIRPTAIASFVVKGFLRDATVTTPGNVGTVKLGGMIDSAFLVGTAARPGSLDDFSVKRTIASFTIAGVAGAGSQLFSNSQVAASTIAAIVARGVVGDNGGTPFGFVADAILSYSRDGKAPLLNLTRPATVNATGDYSARIL